MTNESKREVFKSFIIGVAALVALVCWLTLQPRLPNLEPKDKIGKRLFEDFNDPSQMTRIEFTGIDPQTGLIRSLVLVKDGKSWRLPSLSGFPAENADRLAKIVAPLIQLTVLDVVGDREQSFDLRHITEFHRECGLINPQNFEFERTVFQEQLSSADDTVKKNDKAPSSPEDLSHGSALQIRIEGESGATLLDVLIGSRVPDSSATRDNRFIRLSNEEVVYTADFIGDSTQEVGTTEFVEYPNRVSFDPVDWIDRDLLRISRWDILNMASRDYSFSIEKNEQSLSLLEYQSSGVAVFKQTPDNSISRIWSLERRFQQEKNGSWTELENILPESANNEALNVTADVLGSLKICDVRKKPSSLAELFHTSNTGSALLSHEDTLATFGFATTVQDPLDTSRTEPLLIGEGGTIELLMKTGVKLSIIFGRRFENKRAILAYASYSREALASVTEDESEIAFLEPEAQQQAVLKNERFADWFYLIDEADYNKLQFRLANSLLK